MTILLDGGHAALPDWVYSSVLAEEMNTAVDQRAYMYWRRGGEDDASRPIVRPSVSGHTQIDYVEDHVMRNGKLIEKRCNKCLHVLPANMFHQRKKSRDGHVSQCKDCKSFYDARREERGQSNE